MQKRFLSLIKAIALVMTLAIMPVLLTQAQSATNAAWTSSVTYYTPSATGGTLMVEYYAEGSATPVQAPAITLEPHAAGSLFIGSVAGLPDSFAGSAVLSADVPIIATNVQFASGGQANEYGRLLYAGFQPEDADATFYIPTFLYQKFGSSSLMGVQNVEDSQITANVKVYSVGSTTPTVDQDYDIPSLSSEILAAGDLGLSPGFNGSVVISATGSVVASAQETDDIGRGAYAFEGVANGASTYYMATMLCDVFGGQKSYYAIQNAGSITATTSITFYDTAGSVVATMPATDIGVGNKMSVNPCNEGVPAGTSGSAVIQSTGAPVIAMGKVKAPNGMATAFVGQSVGHTKVAAPYIRWAADDASEWRAYVAVMNVGSADATNVVANYYDGSGSLQGSETLGSGGSPLGQFIKANTNASTAGALDIDGNFGINPYGGAVEIESDQPVVVVVRLTKSVSLGATTKFAEDYNAVSVP
jgi:hypothetical protein